MSNQTAESFKGVRVVGDNIWYVDFTINQATGALKATRIEGDVSDKSGLTTALKNWAHEKGHFVKTVTL